MKQIFSVVTATYILVGCATGTNGPVQISDNLYLIGGQGKFTEESGSVVKARFFQEANTFCHSKGLKLVPVKDSSQDANDHQEASAEVQFRCE